MENKEYKEYVNEGLSMLEESIGKEIFNLAKKQPDIGIPFLEWWAGEISWKELIDMVAVNMEKRVLENQPPESHGEKF